MSTVMLDGIVVPSGRVPQPVLWQPKTSLSPNSCRCRHAQWNNMRNGPIWRCKQNLAQKVRTTNTGKNMRTCGVFGITWRPSMCLRFSEGSDWDFCSPFQWKLHHVALPSRIASENDLEQAWIVDSFVFHVVCTPRLG